MIYGGNIDMYLSWAGLEVDLDRVLVVSWYGGSRVGWNID